MPAIFPFKLTNIKKMILSNIQKLNIYMKIIHNFVYRRPYARTNVQYAREDIYRQKLLLHISHKVMLSIAERVEKSKYK